MSTRLGPQLSAFLEFNRGRGRRGIAIYLAAVTLMIVLAVALGISLLSIYQLKNLNEAGVSVVAFAAAETGIDAALANPAALVPPWNSFDQSVGNASYRVESFLCGAANAYLCFRSVGTYRGTQRAIQIQQPL